MNMHKSNAINQVHELAPPTCMLLLSKNFDPPLFFNVWSSSILQCCSLLIQVHACTLIFLSLSNISLSKWTYLYPNFSPFVINDHKRPDTIWNLCHVIINGYHLKILPWKSHVAWCKELDLGRWLSLESSFLMDTFNWLVPPWNATCRSLVGSLTLIPCSGAPPPMSKHMSIQFET